MRNIKIVERKAIDDISWNRCVHEDPSAKVYNFTDYIDTFATHGWQGLIIGDYDACLALPKFPLLHKIALVTPLFVQQLQLIKKTSFQLSVEEQQSIAALLLKKFSLLNFSCGNELLLECSKKIRTNFVLDLRPSYTELKSAYNKNGKRNTIKAQKENLTLRRDIEIDLVIKFYREAYGKVSGLKEKHFKKFEKLSSLNGKNFETQTFGVFDKENRPIFAALLAKDAKAFYYLLGAPNDLGRKLGATYFFIDSIIKDYSETALNFDFEGSDIDNVASFYQSFGPQKETYSQFTLNQLKFPIRQVAKKYFGF